jgi:hypothetical protein
MQWISARLRLTLCRVLDAAAAFMPTPRQPVRATVRVGARGIALAKCDMRSHQRRRQRGATFMDVLVGILIAAVTIAIGLPQMSRLIQPHRITAASRSLASQFASARMKAIAQNARHRVNFDAGAGTYALEVETAPNTWTAVGGSRQLPDGVTFSPVDDDPIIGTQGMLAQDFNVTVTSPAYSQIVSVNVLGNVAIGDLHANEG